MSKPKTYTQCHMIKKVGEIGDFQFKEKTAYIPTHLARVGDFVSLKCDVDGHWESGWEILSAGHTRSDIPDVRKIRRRHRDATKDSMKKPQQDR